MTHLYYLEDRRRVPEYGKEVKSSATIIDTPPLLIVAIRAYKQTYEGINPVTEAWMVNKPRDLLKRINFTADHQSEKALNKMEKELEKIIHIRVIVSTQPRLSNVPKKIPDLLEIPISGGTIEDQLKYSKSILGKKINIDEVFNPGEGIDVIGVTKGKGFQGPVKRWGIRILSRKSRKQKRAVASIGPWVPRGVMPQVPRAGQMGFHNRTEYNKRIMLMGSDNERINPKEGFKNYGFIKGDYILIKGSIMGPSKRLITLRKAVRPTRYPDDAPNITYIHSEYNKKEGTQL
jgi:large subunit ribosomal protein L3